MIHPQLTGKTMTTTTNPRLVRLIHDLSFKTGTFKLASGGTSNFYIDVRMTATHPEGAALIGDELLKRIREMGLAPDAIGGMALGAVPIVMAVTARSLQFGSPLPAFIVRRETKGHGTGKKIEGHIRDGQAVIIVDDTVTTGKSTLESIDSVLEAFPRCKIIAVFGIVDRQEGGRENIEARGLSFYSLVTKKDLFDLEGN
jgi:orotate phosphoribosyltransferase